MTGTITVREACELVVDCPHSTPEWTETGVFVFRSNNIRGGRLDLTTQSFTTEQDYERRVRRAVPTAGDLIITREAPMGEVAMIPQGLRGCLGQRMVLLRPRLAVANARFMLYALMSPGVQAAIRVHEGTGSTVSNLRIPDLERLELPLPSLAEQEAIASVLGALDDKIELNRRMNRTLEELASALFKSWFVDFDPVQANIDGRRPVGVPEHLGSLFPSQFDDSQVGPIPTGWTVRPLDTIARFLNGLALQKYPPDDTGDLPVIKIAQLRAGTSDGAERASASLPPEYIIQDGDVIFSWSGSLLVDVWCGGPGALNQHLFKVTSDEFPKWFFLEWVREHLPEFQGIAADKATTMGHIRRHHLSDALVVVPEAPLLSKLSDVEEPLLAKRIGNCLENRTLAALRGMLLPALLSGEVSIKHAENIVGEVA